MVTDLNRLIDACEVYSAAERIGASDEKLAECQDMIDECADRYVVARTNEAIDALGLTVNEKIERIQEQHRQSNTEHRQGATQ